MQHMNLRTAFLRTLIVSLSAAAFLGIIAILMPDLIGADEEILVTTLLLGLYSLPPLACSIVIGKQKQRHLMWIGIIGSFTAWLIWLPLIWGDPWRWNSAINWDELLFKTGFTCTFAALWSTHYGLIMLLRLDQNWPRRVRTGTIIAASILTATGTLCMWGEIENDLTFRFLAVIGILVGCGTMLTPTIALLEIIQRRGGRESISSDVRIKLTCPRCNAEQTLPTGPSQCQACGLRIDINVEEPRCACGYLLFKLEGDQCPECGRPARCTCGCLIDAGHKLCPKCGAETPNNR